MKTQRLCLLKLVGAFSTAAQIDSIDGHKIAGGGGTGSNSPSTISGILPVRFYQLAEA